MDKLDLKSADIKQVNIEKLQQLFPDVVTEVIKDGKTQLAVDFDALKQELSSVIMDEKQERYQFTWPDKGKAKMLAAQRITSTLRPCVEESVNFDTTQNLYIEGDNLDVLKLLQETYLGKIKMIYIDPPYNTGNDFVYEDDFTMSEGDYTKISGDYDEQGNRLEKNPDSNGRFHTDWLNMIYPRLKVAKDLLTDDGVIFISIDDNEVDNLRKICDETFSPTNFIAQIVVEGTPKNDPKIVSTAHEYCLVYVKNYDIAKQCIWGVENPVYQELIDIFNSYSPDYERVCKELKNYYHENNLEGENITNYKYADKHGIFRTGPIDDPQRGGPRDIRYNPITNEPLVTPNRGWSCTIETWNDWVKQDLILFPKDNSKLCSKKTYITKGQLDILRALYKIQTRKDTDALTKLFNGKKVFSFPKPVELIKTFIDGSIHEDNIVLDFFSGSGTTAQAVFELNAQKNNNNIKFILVQLPEDLLKNLKAASGNREKQVCQNAIDFCDEFNKPRVLTEIAKERLRRIGKNIVGGVRARRLILALECLSLIVAICEMYIIILPLCRSLYSILP